MENTEVNWKEGLMKDKAELVIRRINRLDRGTTQGLSQHDRECREVAQAYLNPWISVDAEELARRFHDTYELLAPEFGYETRQETKIFDPGSPNGRLMIAVCKEIASNPPKE